MKTMIALLCLGLSAAPAFAEKACEELKSEIAAKLDAKGVKHYTLAIVENEAIKDQKVIGSCEGGKKKSSTQKRNIFRRCSEMLLGG